MHIEEFQVPFAGTHLFGSHWQPTAPRATALILHGGGLSNAAGFDALRTHLAGHGVASVAFDAVGHGRTGGAQLGTTLEGRVQQVVAVAEALALRPEALTLAGFSMGAYVAVKAAVALGVPRLCLAIPAAYAPEAYAVPFGPAFSAILRTPRSWARSDAFDAVRQHHGHLLVVSAERDEVVPADIPATYATSAVNGASVHHHVVPGSLHNLSAHYEQDPAAREAVYSQIAALCLRAV